MWHVWETVEVRGDLVRRSEGNRPTGKLRCGWEYNKKINIQEVGFGGIYWINLTQNGDR